VKYEKSLKTDEQLHLDSIIKNDHNNNINSSIKIEEDTSLSNHNHSTSIYSSDLKNYSEDEFSDIDSLKVINKSPLAHNSSNMIIQPSLVDKKKTRVSSNNSNNTIHRPTTIIITGNNDFEIKSNISSENGNAGSSLVLDTRIPNVLIESPVSTKTQKMFDETRNESKSMPIKQEDDVTVPTEPVKRTAIIEVRPTLVSSTEILDQHIQNKNSPSNFVILRQKQQQQTNNNDTKSVSSSMSPQSSTLLLKSLNETKSNFENIYVDESAKTKTLSLLRSPSSPPPQFPAIGANELNETHQNYTVIRSGDIIEKNGTYYSNDGTIRGYSGTVKKLASSSTLNEVFIKQRELEQQHEKEYELELMQKAEEEKQLKADQNALIAANIKDNSCKQQQQQQQHLPKTNSYTNLNGNLGLNKSRVSLGNIITNEKRTNSNSATSTLSSNNFFF
jgi:hypothetical protein